jgi:hypothetical protein
MYKITFSKASYMRKITFLKAIFGQEIAFRKVIFRVVFRSVAFTSS